MNQNENIRKAAEKVLDQYFHPKATPTETKKAIINAMIQFLQEQSQQSEIKILENLLDEIS